MNPLELVNEKDPILRKVCETVKFEELGEVAQQAQAMLGLLKGMANGASLAAPQVGIAKRFFVVRYHPIFGLKDLPGVVINPVFEDWSEGFTSAAEGCLSFSGGRRTTFVRRHDWVVIEWYDLKYRLERGVFYDREARLMQHEIDHLNGKLIFS